MKTNKKDLEHMIYGVLAAYLKQLTGEPWVLFKDKVLFNNIHTNENGRRAAPESGRVRISANLNRMKIFSSILNGPVAVVLHVIKTIQARF